MAKSRSSVLEVNGLMVRDRAEEFLVKLVNAKMPEEVGTDAAVDELRALTADAWPDLWRSVDDWGGVQVLRKIRWYLRQFWNPSDPQTRDWFIQRARQYHYLHTNHPNTPGAVDDEDPQRKMLVQQLKQFLDEFNSARTADEARTKSSWVNIGVEMLLDYPPRRAAFEKSLSHLQQIVDKLKYCKEELCPEPYFIRTKKGQERCLGCRTEAKRRWKRQHWDTNKATYNKKRRAQ